MSARITAGNKDSGLIAHALLGVPIPALPQPFTSQQRPKKDKYKTKTTRRAARRYRRAVRVSAKENPWCVTCRERMTRNGKAPYGVTKWWCNQCEYNIKAYYQRAHRKIRTNSRRDPPPDRPCCVTCHQPYYTRGTSPRTGETKWYCGRCDYVVLSHVIGGRGTQRRYPINNRPHCVTCHRHLSYKAKSAKNSEGWACRRCGLVIPAHCLPPPLVSPTNPCCVACRHTMRSRCGYVWHCYECNYSIVKAPRRPRNLKELCPCCLTCRNLLAFDGKNRWRCSTCNYTCQQEGVTRPYSPRHKKEHPKRHQKLIDDVELLHFCLAAVPRYYAIRDDVAMELVVLILSKKICRCEVTPLKVRQVGRALLKQQSEFANISLETRNREGIRLEERLVG